MRVTVAAVGRARGRAEAELFAAYVKRLPWPLTLKEIEERAGAPAERCRREGERLLAALPGDALVVALDPGGRMLDSPGFAAALQGWQDSGRRDLGFVIGGADGLDPAVLARADARLSLGPMTWPHMLARVMLAEQLFRAASILAGHPYHRE
ncbi:MAG TPA: 23S rRNA (pseudouridine(1915)-N(3))-methyltransferase RlmH [Alphaproteobacteria bacterium]|nr:23S rRNA (pseudouridine(1915)-N(3))-methyltransferase RlmH [Alphaproteobacteria bacterium]